MMDIVQSLRRTDFPDDARAALKHLERVCISLSEASVNIPGLAEVQRNEVPNDFIDEFIFHQLDWQGNRRHLTAIQELQLLDILCTYFQECKNSSLFRQMFYRLFPLDLSPMSYRTLVLCKSVSLAIAANSALLLTCVAEWLNQDLLANSSDTGHLPGLTNSIATTIVQDYCLLQSVTPKGLTNIASTSPEFACFFVRALTQMFDMKGSPQYSFGSPPARLLHAVTDWVADNPSLLRTSISVPANTPSHRKQHLETAPLLGLVRWCVKAPLIALACGKMLKKIEDCAKNASLISSAKTQLTLSPVFSRLHLAILSCLLLQVGDVHSLHSAKPYLEPFTMSQMVLLAQELMTLERQMQADSASVRQASPPDSSNEIAASLQIADCLQVSIDRFAQTLQVAKATNSLHSQPGDLTHLQSVLPSNALLQVVVSHWDPQLNR